MAARRKLSKTQVARLEKAEEEIRAVYREKMEKLFPIGTVVVIRSAYGVLENKEDVKKLNSFRIVGYEPLSDVARSGGDGELLHDYLGRVALRRLDKTGKRVYGETKYAPTYSFWTWYKKA